MISRILSAIVAVTLTASVAVSAPPSPGKGGGQPVTSPCTSNLTIVVLGSSTAAGSGAMPRSMGWVYRYASYLASISANNRVINLAVGGYTTYHCLPTNSAPVPNRPRPDTTRNITYAISLNPSAIIVNLPTNDIAAKFRPEETQRNFHAIAAAAFAAHIPIWFTTSQPRGLSSDQRAQLAELRDWLTVAFGVKAIDFWSPVAAPDGNILPQYDSGDHTHVNNLGHAMLFRKVVSMNIPDVVCAVRFGGL